MGSRHTPRRPGGAEFYEEKDILDKLFFSLQGCAGAGVVREECATYMYASWKARVDNTIDISAICCERGCSRVWDSTLTEVTIGSITLPYLWNISAVSVIWRLL